MTTTSIEGEKIDLRSIQEAAERGKVNEILGEPLEIKDFGSYRIAAHEWDRGRTELLLVWPGVPVAFVREYSFLTLAYQTDGSFLELKIWDLVESGRRRAPNEVIRLHRDLLVEREAHDQEAQEASAMELARLGPICEMPFAEAVSFTREDIIDHYLTGCQSDLLSLHTRMMWACLAANDNHPGAQNLMGRYFEDKHEGSGHTSDLIEAYKWYSLAYEQDVGGDYHRSRVVFQLMPSERSEAEQLVVDWRPNPSECETFSDTEQSPFHTN